MSCPCIYIKTSLFEMKKYIHIYKMKICKFSEWIKYCVVASYLSAHNIFMNIFINLSAQPLQLNCLEIEFYYLHNQFKILSLYLTL